MAGNNMFINTTGLQIEKSMPSLVGMDFSQVAYKRPNDIGKAISDFATKSQNVAQNNKYMKIQNELDQMEKSWKLQYMTDPNAYSSKERRAEITKTYNDLIEQKKNILINSKGSLSSEQYSKLENYFKEQTYDSLFNLQKNENVGYLKETTDDVLLNTNIGIEELSLMDNEELRNTKMEDILNNIKALETLGVDTRSMQLEAVTTAQDRITTYEIEKSIINNIDDSRFYLTDKEGDPIRDSQGNPIIDNNKKLKELYRQREIFLSKESITDAAKSVAKATGMNEKDAFNYIKNTRDRYWKIKQDRYEAVLSSKQQQSYADVIAYQNKVQTEANKTIDDMRDNQNKDISTFISTVTGSPSDVNDLSNPKIIFTLTDGHFENMADVEKYGYRFNILPDDVVGIIKSFSNPKNGEEMTKLENNLVTFIEKMPGTNPNIVSQALAQLDDTIGIPYGTLVNIMGKGDVPKSVAQRLFVSSNNINNIDWSSVDPSPRGGNSPFRLDVMGSNYNQMLYKELITNPSLYLQNIPTDFYNRPAQQKVDFIVAQYNRNKTSKDAIDNISKYVNSMLKKDTRTAYPLNTNDGSTLYQAAYETGKSNAIRSNLKTVKKYDDVVTESLGDTTVRTKDDIMYSHGIVNSMIEKLQEGALNPRDIQSDNYYNPYFVDKVVPLYLNKLNSGELDVSEIPIELYNNPQIQDYYNKKLKEL